MKFFTRKIHNVIKLISFITLTGLSTSLNAALPTNAILTIDTGTATCLFSPSGDLVNDCGFYSYTRSYFNMALKGDSILGNNDGIILGAPQSASGAHTGLPNGSELPGMDTPWEFFQSTGMHFTTGTGINILVDDGAGNVTLDFSNWRVVWNEIPVIDMGSGAHSGGVESVGAMTCAATCADGDTYTLTYYATVPAGDPSGFGGVPYSLYLAGSILVPAALTSGDAIANGNLGLGKMRVTQAELTNDIGVEDTDFPPIGGYYNFTVTGVAGTTEVVIPLLKPLPANAIYRKYINSAFTTFTADGTNAIASAPLAGNCPAAGNAAYNHFNGLVEGDECVQLTIEDDGPYDSNNGAGTIDDPGAISTTNGVNVFVDSRISGSDGCSINNNSTSSIKNHLEWVLIIGFLFIFGIFKHKRQN